MTYRIWLYDPDKKRHWRKSMCLAGRLAGCVFLSALFVFAVCGRQVRQMPVWYVLMPLLALFFLTLGISAYAMYFRAACDRGTAFVQDESGSLYAVSLGREAFLKSQGLERYRHCFQVRRRAVIPSFRDYMQIRRQNAYLRCLREEHILERIVENEGLARYGKRLNKMVWLQVGETELHMKVWTAGCTERPAVYTVHSNLPGYAELAEALQRAPVE